MKRNHIPKRDSKRDLPKRDSKRDLQKRPKENHLKTELIYLVIIINFYYKNL